MKRLLIILLLFPFVLKAQGLTGVLGLLDKPKTKFYVTNFLELQNATNYAKDGSVIYIQNDITVPNTANIVIDKNITIQGISYASMPTLNQTDSTYDLALFEIMDGANVTFKNLKLDGHEVWQETPSETHPIGILVGATDNANNTILVDSCVILGWAYSGIRVVGDNNSIEVKNSSFINNRQYGLGYGINVGRNAYAEVHHCVFDSNRHSITSDGWVDDNGASSYDLYNNDFYTATAYGGIVDVHGKGEISTVDESDPYYEYAGGTFNIFNNTWHDASATTANYAIVIRGKPYIGAYIHNNKFASDWIWWMGKSGENGFRPAIRQYPRNEALSNYWGGIFAYDNGFSGTKPPFNYDIYVKFFSIQDDSGWVNLCAISDSLTTTADTSTIKTELLFGDFNGDGTTDIISKYNVSSDDQMGGSWNEGVDQDSTGHIFVSFSGLSRWKLLNTQNYAITDLDIADVNGDGKSDLIYNESTWSDSGMASFVALPEAFGTYNLYTRRDFNGDGANDLYRTYKYGEIVTGDTLYASDFSATEDWTEYRGTGSANNDGINGFDDVYKYWLDAENNSHIIRRTLSGVSAGDTIAVFGKFYIPSANTNVKGMFLTGLNDVNIIGSQYYDNQNGSWKEIANIFTTTSDNPTFSFYARNGVPATTFVGANSSSDDQMYFRDIIIIKVSNIE